MQEHTEGLNKQQDRHKRSKVKGDIIKQQHWTGFRAWFVRLWKLKDSKIFIQLVSLHYVENAI